MERQTLRRSFLSFTEQKKRGSRGFCFTFASLIIVYFYRGDTCDPSHLSTQRTADFFFSRGGRVVM